ncbi:MAG TPA: DUF4430 domain-containing protein [Solirubrobacteraceae bacterium]|nr:DUF4430 domain-containing protein [Solirubrobacteraceae bacterium]
MRRARRARRALAAAALAAPALAALAGCGLAVGPAPSVGQLLITRDFGARVVHRSGDVRARAGESVLALLRAGYSVRGGTRHSNVTSIGGLSGAPGAGGSGEATKWLYYVNGVQVRKAPALRALHLGDHVWWDLHDASHSDDQAAVVGAYPEPFLNGTEGKRLPVRVECAADARAACALVTRRLRAAGVPAALAAIGSGGAPETLRVMVGPWVYLEGDIEASSIGRGPLASGVYARIPAAGRELELLDEGGERARTLRGSAGLVAATRGENEAPVWVITGTDVAGVDLAAHALARSALEDRFAVALQGAATIPLPLPGPR